MIWSIKYKPNKISEFYGNYKQVITASKWIKNSIKNKTCNPLIIYGDYGVGKTTLAKLILEKNNYFVINLDYDTLMDKNKIKIETLKRIPRSASQKRRLVISNLNNQ